MVTPKHTVTCTGKTVVARDIFEFRFSKPSGFSFQPGQFVLFDVALPENASDIQPRAFSIASTPAEDDLLFVAKMKEGGRGSRWIQETLKEGLSATFTGPLGRFVLDHDTGKDLLFICTGAGLAPFRSQIIETLSRGDKRRIDLVFGSRAEDEIFWMDELDGLTKKYENFFLHLPLSNPSDAWTGHRGRVQTLVPLISPDLATKCVYVCGNPDMTTEVKKLCLEQWGVKKEDLHVEGYI